MKSVVFAVFFFSFFISKCIFSQERNNYSVVVNDFSRDRTLFDSDMAHGNNNAEINLSGTSDAPDGNIVEGRAVSTEDGGATSTEWAEIAKVEDGKWAGILNVPRSSSWYKAEIRVQGSSAQPAQTNKRFGVGLIVFYSGQSNYSRVTVVDGDAEPMLIGDNGDNFQMWHIVNRGKVEESDENSRINGPNFITDSNPKTHALQAMASMYHQNAPGLKVMALFDVKPGVHQDVTLNDSDNKRKWESIQKLFSLGDYEGTGPMADGQVLGIFVQGHMNGIPFGRMAEWYLAACLGMKLDGTDIPGISKTERFTKTNLLSYVYGEKLWVNHIWTEAFPGLLSGRTRILLKDAGGVYSTTNYPMYVDRYRINREKLADLFPEYFSWANEYPFMKRFYADGSEAPHFDVDNIYGSTLKGQTLAVCVLKQIGATPFETPHFDILRRGDNYIELGSSVGPVTTIARGQGDTINYPKDPTGPFREGKAEVLGFQYADFSAPKRIEIVDSIGNPSTEGFVRVYLDEGYEKLYYGMGNAGLPDGNFEANESLFMRHLPIVNVGLKGRILEYGVWVEPYTNREFINQNVPPTVEVTGVKNLAQNMESKINVFPNPSNGDFIFVDIPQYEGRLDAKVKIYDLAGRVIFERLYVTEQQLKIDLSDNPGFSSGIFIVEVITPEMKSYQKIAIR